MSKPVYKHTQALEEMSQAALKMNKLIIIMKWIPLK